MQVVNCTKYDMCACGHERMDHKYTLSSSGKIDISSTKKCVICDCKHFKLSDNYKE